MNRSTVAKGKPCTVLKDGVLPTLPNFTAKFHLGLVMRNQAHRMHRSLAVVLVASCTVSASLGCRSLVNNGWIAPPGPMNYQQANAVVHDPFPQADIGHNDHSMRPPDYQTPLALPVRNQMKNQVAPWLAP